MHTEGITAGSGILLQVVVSHELSSVAHAWLAACLLQARQMPECAWDAALPCLEQPLRVYCWLLRCWPDMT